MSTKIDGTRLRHDPCRAVTKIAKFRLLSTTRMTRNPNTVAVTCHHAGSTCAKRTWLIRTSSAPTGAT